MAQSTARTETTTRTPRRATGTAQRKTGRPFFGMIDSVIVADDGAFAFEGAIPAEDAIAVWAWFVRDLAPDLIDPEVTEEDPAALPALEALMPDLLTRAKDVMAQAGTSREVERRVRSQLGEESAWDRLPMVITALKCRTALEKAQSFGRAANGIHEDAALATALQSMPLQDRSIAALLMMAALRHVAAPGRLVNAAIRLAGGASDTAITRSGFGPMIEALLAHAQSQLPVVAQVGTFADIDLVCRAVDRFHRLMRAVNFVEISRRHRWAGIAASLTKSISDRLEPKMREIPPDVNKALRRSRDGNDRLDSDQLLAALNGLFLLATIRDCRDSLAVNAAFDQTWGQVGQALELHLQRNMDLLRQNPSDRGTVARVEAGLKMAELRFGTEYADIMRRARDTAERRAG